MQEKAMIGVFIFFALVFSLAIMAKVAPMFLVAVGVVMVIGLSVLVVYLLVWFILIILRDIKEGRV